MNSYSFAATCAMGEPMPNLLLCPADLEAYLRDLPVAAAVLPRLQALLLRDDTYLDEVVELVRFDPALATRVIHAASTAFYGRSREVRSLEDALVRLGMRETYRITAAFALGKFLNTPLRIYGISASDYWRRSIACALVMEDQAPARWLDECAAYTVGLLHALGMVFIDRHLRAVGDHGMLLRELPASPLPRQETRLTGMTHAQITGFVLRKWDFGAEIVEPIEYQFDPGRAPAHGEMATLLADARVTARDVVAELATAPAEPSPIARKIQALENWMH